MNAPKDEAVAGDAGVSGSQTEQQAEERRKQRVRDALARFRPKKQRGRR
jgi:hypothetical protein